MRRTRGPVLAYLTQPSHPPPLRSLAILFPHQLIEVRALSRALLPVVRTSISISISELGFVRGVVFGLDALAYAAEAVAGGAEVGGKGGGDFAADAGGEFAAFAVGCYPDLEGAVGVRGEEGEGA
ncbi:hypothetical protein V492_08026 [Pseudogymnoascus sp. VKM F-4246]|nr:hypothetical protein V492_08026 [Pseudogymnoascus sp. VKM F-4246]